MSKRIHVALNTTHQRLPGINGLCYAAGLFDGEGCIHIAKQSHPGSRHGHIYRLVVSVAQNHLRSLVDFQDFVGIAGRLYPVKRQGSANRDSYTLTYDGRTAEALLRVLLPFLGRKADEAVVALAFQTEGQIRRHFGPKGCPTDIWHKRVYYYRKLRSLK
jgi:6-pyruvoyl-tetrahydropterin synthase